MSGNAIGANSYATLYDQVVNISCAYLGPSANQFIAGQVQNHLHKPPQDLSSNDLTKLIDWIQAAVCYLTEDSKLVERYTKELKKLSSQSTPRDY